MYMVFVLEALMPNIISEVQLTSGEWEMAGQAVSYLYPHFIFNLVFILCIYLHVT